MVGVHRGDRGLLQLQTKDYAAITDCTRTIERYRNEFGFSSSRRTSPTAGLGSKRDRYHFSDLDHQLPSARMASNGRG